MNKIVSSIKSGMLPCLLLCFALIAACGPKEDPVIAVTGVSLDQSSLTLDIGGTANLTATVSPSNATNKAVSWSTSNQSVATVNNGTVTAVAAGTVTITATAGGKSAICSVTVNKKVTPVSSLTLDKTEISLVEDESLTLKATVSPSNAEDNTVNWSSSDSNVASVDQSGNVTALRTGTATITAAAGGKTATCSVTVSKKHVEVESVELDKTEVTITEGENTTLTATVKPDDATDPVVTWESNNPEVATVEDGVVTAVKEGTAVITAKAGEKEATCAVTVEQSEENRIKAILTEFYNAMDGPNWKHQENWCSDEYLGLWEGVTVFPDNSLQLSFNGFGLKGEIPECIGDLTGLKELYIRNEPGVTGTLPQSFKKLVNLESLEISSTSMTSLADVFPVPSKLNWTMIHFNESMTGPLPESLGANDDMVVLSIIGNAFTGAPPASWARHYKCMALIGNNLSGTIPDTFLTGEDVPYKLLTILNQNPPGLDISGIDMKGCWPKEAVEDIITGELFKFADVVKKNKYTVFLEWAPWCPFSKALLPQLVDYYKQYHKDGLEIIATVMNSEEQLKVWDDLPGQIREINEKGYDIWYNCYFPDFKESMPIYPSATPLAEVYDNEGNILFSGFFEFNDPVRKRYGHLASTELIPFLETLFGPAQEIEEYTSTDYSKDGEVITLQKATVGKGINLVFMGDAYVDKDMGKGGLYETLMKQSMEEFFAIEPFKTFRERFNVYAVKVVSPNGWTGPGYETALGAVFTHGSSSSGVLDKCFEYALKVPEIKDGKNLMISVLVNSRNAGGITNLIESSQSGVAFTSSEGNNPESFGMILRHEAGGHAFAFLDDEYFNIQTEPTADHIAHRKSMYEKYGWYANIDFTNDPTAVKWSAFLTDERYKDEVGIFEGGSLYARNAYRPTNHSMMNDHFEYFNAPSRWAIYKRIMELSGEEASFEKFLEYDAINRGKKQANSAPRTRSDIKIEHTPPVIIP